jgi:GrpB-like predicted nucleotidyltransferase (UPF0157 family)
MATRGPMADAPSGSPASAEVRRCRAPRPTRWNVRRGDRFGRLRVAEIRRRMLRHLGLLLLVSLMKLLEPSEYQPLADVVFMSVMEDLSPLLPGARFEHVGASSIPGAISKGDLDICIVVELSSHQRTVEALESMGYVIKIDTLRTPELCMLLSPCQDLDVALQVVARGSQFEFFMRFREALRADASLVQRYNQLKRDFASMSPAKYRDEKAKFIESVLGAPSPPPGGPGNPPDVDAVA